MQSENTKRFTKISLALLIYTLLVILWGAWVRISHSGDGCGNHWPLCQGELIPNEQQYKTWIEYGHRLMSGAFGIIVVYIFIIGKKTFNKSHWIQKALNLSLIFTITEALLGAGLVKLGLVTSNDSPLRLIAMSLHLINSLMLVASIGLTYQLSKHELWQKKESPSFDFNSNAVNRIKTLFTPLFILICLTGAIAALSTTLFPSENLIDGLKNDFSTDSHYLLKLRGLHPLMGVFIGGLLSISAFVLSQYARDEDTKKQTYNLFIVILCGIIVGGSTLILLSPVFMKLIHLAMTYLIWIQLIFWIITLKATHQKQ